MSNQMPAVIYHNLNELIEKNELDLVLKGAFKSLNKGHVTSIANAFFTNTKICVNGIPYIKIKGLAIILRTGSSGAERPLIYQGINGVISPSEIIEIETEEYISGLELIKLIGTRIAFTSGKTKQYLNVAMELYYRMLNNYQVSDIKEVFLEEIKNNRHYLKKERIEKYQVSCCEFSGVSFINTSEVEFAHIESVVTNPSRALDLNNGVIILKNLHLELTQSHIHDLAGMYQYCLNKGFSTAWAAG